MMRPDRFIEHGAPAEMYEDAGLTVSDIVATALAVLGRDNSMLAIGSETV
jgi:1-deoxy-D-xylulose-5-phosphate synthase